MMRRYLLTQPAQLNAPAELMVLGNQSLEMVQGYTRNKADLLYALDHLQSALPYKQMNGTFFAERFGQSIDALQQIALQNKGVSGRKNIIWVGHGGPSIYTEGLPVETVDQLNQYVHDTTNMLVDARVSLFVIYPGLRVNGPSSGFSVDSANTDIGDDDPFSGDINFGVFVNETGGQLFYNRNDINTEIKQAQELGSKYYTLTYQPPSGDADGKFRRIRVTLRDPKLHVLTKAGYFAPNQEVTSGTRQQTMVGLSEALRANIPFDTLSLSIFDLVRHPDTDTAQFTVQIAPKNLEWQPSADGGSTINLTLAAASLSGRRDFLASKVQGFTVLASNPDPDKLSKAVTRIPVTIRIPRKTQTVRIVVQLGGSGRTGTAEITRKAIDDAPQAPTPTPKLILHPQAPQRPSPSSLPPALP